MPNSDWWTLTQAHAAAVEQEGRAYLELAGGSGSPTQSSNEPNFDPTSLANWERATLAVPHAWERLHRHAVSRNARF